MSTKKRQILPVLNNTIAALVAMSADAANLEMMDNEQASKRLKRDIIEFKNGQLKELTDLITTTRTEIAAMPSQKRAKSPDIQANLRRKKEQQNNL